MIHLDSKHFYLWQTHEIINIVHQYLLQSDREITLEAPLYFSHNLHFEHECLNLRIDHGV